MEILFYLMGLATGILIDLLFKDKKEVTKPNETISTVVVEVISNKSGTFKTLLINGTVVKSSSLSLSYLEIRNIIVSCISIKIDSEISAYSEIGTKIENSIVSKLDTTVEIDNHQFKIKHFTEDS